MPQKLLSTCVTGNNHLGHDDEESAVDINNNIDYFGDITRIKNVEDNDILRHDVEDNSILCHETAIDVRDRE